MKERENREFWIRQTTALLAMYINGYLYISLYCYHRVSSGSAESGPRLNQTVQGPFLSLSRPYRSDIVISSKMCLCFT